MFCSYLDIIGEVKEVHLAGNRGRHLTRHHLGGHLQMTQK